MVAFLLVVFGGGATLLGCALGYIAGVSFYASRTDPNWTWGPNGYLLGMMKGFAYAATALVPAGIALAVAGWRLWRVRRVGP